MRKSGHTVFLSWLLSYLIILMVPMGLSLIGYYRTEKILEEEIGKVGNAILSQKRGAMDALMKDVRRLAFSISLNKNLQSLLYRYGPMSASIRYSLWEITDRDLNAYATVFNPDLSFYVYVAHQNTILVPGAWYSPEVAYGALHSESDISYDAWLSLLGTIKTHSIIALGSTPGSQGLLYLQPITGESAESAGTVGVVIPGAVVDAILTNADWAGTEKNYIYGGRGEQLYSVGRHPGTELAELPETDSGQFRIGMDGIEYVGATARSAVMDWTYAALVPVDYFWARLNSLRWLTYAGLLASAAIGAALAFALARRNYNPLHALVREIQAWDRSPDAPAARNEFAFLRQAMLRTLHEKEDSSRILVERKPELRAAFLQAMLKQNGLPLGELRRGIEEYDISLPHPFFMVLLFHCQEESPRALAERVRLGALDRFHGGTDSETFEADGSTVCVLNFPEGQSTEELCAQAEMLKKDMEGESGRTIAAAMGPVSGLQDMPASYQHALTALEYRLVVGTDEVIRYDRIKTGNRTHQFTAEDQRKLINALKAGELREALQLLDRAFAENVDGGGTASGQAVPPSVERVRYFLYDLAATTAKALGGIDAVFKGSLRESSDPFAAVTRAETAREARHALEELFRTACAFVESKKRSHNANLRLDIEAYVRGAFADRNLSNTAIADRFSMNSSYLSRYYKEQAGEGLAEYIARVRIGRAKELLAGDLPLAAVAGKVGLSGDIALIKLFKRFEGVTPGRFKARDASSGQEL